VVPEVSRELLADKDPAEVVDVPLAMVPVAAATGDSMPQLRQNPSSMAPEQPGCWQLMLETINRVNKVKSPPFVLSHARAQKREVNSDWNLEAQSPV
jgi:hypothetical protein